MKMKTRPDRAREKKEVIVYTKSEDLTRMCDHLNLNCENPIRDDADEIKVLSRKGSR